MKKNDVKLQRNEGCQGCRKDCQFNGLTTDANRNNKMDKYGCNSSKFEDITRD